MGGQTRGAAQGLTRQLARWALHASSSSSPCFLLPSAPPTHLEFPHHVFSMVQPQAHSNTHTRAAGRGFNTPTLAPPAHAQSQAQFNTYVQSGVLLNNYAHVFDLLIRLRQVGGRSCVLHSLPCCCPSCHAPWWCPKGPHTRQKMRSAGRHVQVAHDCLPAHAHHTSVHRSRAHHCVHGCCRPSTTPTSSCTQRPPRPPHKVGSGPQDATLLQPPEEEAPAESCQPRPLPLHSSSSPTSCPTLHTPLVLLSPNPTCCASATHRSNACSTGCPAPSNLLPAMLSAPGSGRC